MWRIVCVSVLLFVAVHSESYGNCPPSPLQRLLWNYSIRRPPLGILLRELIEDVQYGPAAVIISCIEVTPIGSQNGIATIAAGGVGYNYVKMKFEPVAGNPLDFNVHVYGAVAPRIDFDSKIMLHTVK